MIKILIVEDDEHIAMAASEILHYRGYQPSICKSGNKAVELINQNHYDLILLDVMLPELNGFEVMKKTLHRKIPIIFITAREGIYDKLKGFQLGAEDYLVKPFEMMELLARVDVVLRRTEQPRMKGSYFYLDVYLNINSHVIEKNRKPVKLTPKEFHLASYFIRNQGTVLKRDDLINEVWGNEYDGVPRTLDNHVSQLRRKLG